MWIGIKKIVACLLLVVICSSCGYSGNKNQRYEKSFVGAFDTVTTITAYSKSQQDFNFYAEFVENTLLEYHQLYDIYNDYQGINNIKTINSNAGISPVKVDSKIIDLLEYAKEQCAMTDGKVNIAMGSVLKIWHEYRTAGMDNPESAKVPTKEELENANTLTDINDVIIDKEQSTVYLKKFGMSIDVGAIAKGYATQEIVQNQGRKDYPQIISALVNVGGNASTIGKKDDNKLWTIGVQNPKKPEEIVQRFEVMDASMVTSGDYERTYKVGDKSYHHIIDPVTLFPSKHFSSVTVICDNSSVADVLSTALFNMSYQDGKELIEKYEKTQNFGEIKAIWIYRDSKIRKSINLQYSNKYLK